MGELELSINEMQLPNKHKVSARAHLRTAARIGATIVKRAIPAAVKAGTFGGLDLDEVYEKAIAEQAEKLAEEQIKKLRKIETVGGRL